MRSRCWCCRRRRMKDWFFVELVVIAHCISQFPVGVITQKYALDWISSNVFNSTSGGSWQQQHIPPSPCDPNITDYERQLSNKAHSLTSLFFTVKSLVWGVPALVMTVLLGAGSDRLGRRFAILPPLFGLIIHGMASYLVIRTDSPVVFLLIGDFLYGFTGSLHTIIVSCLAYVTERTPAERRMLRITLLQLCVLVSGMLTAIVIGPVVDGAGAANTVLIAFSISLINFVYVFLFLPNDEQKVDQKPVTTDDQSNVLGQCYTHNEDGISIHIGSDNNHIVQLVADLDTSGYAFENSGSGDHEHPPGFPRFRHVAHQTSINVVDGNAQPEAEESRVELQTRHLCDGFQRVVSLFLYPGPHRVRLNILMAAFVFSVLPTFDHSLKNLFEMNQPLCWTVRDIGMFTGATLAISALGALVVTPTMKKCANDWHIAITASVAAVITHAYKFFVRSTLMMYLSSSLSMFVILLLPSIRSIMSVLVSDNNQGALFGAIAGVDILCMMLSSVIFNTIYSKTLEISSGFFFLVMAAFYAVTCMLLLIYHVTVKVETRRQEVQCDASEPAA